MRKDFAAERVHERVSGPHAALSPGHALNKMSIHSYFPTVYEPTVFENYVHGEPALRSSIVAAGD